LSAIGGWTPLYASQTIAGSPATVLQFPAFDNLQALGMPNDADPNGGEGGLASLNNWTLVMDVKFPTLDNFTGLWKTDALGSGDGDYFINLSGQIGIASQYGGFVAAKYLDAFGGDGGNVD